MSVLLKKMLRSMVRNRGQSLAVVMVILCGTSCYIALNSVYRNLLLTRDSYYAQYRFADFEIYLERAPNAALFKLEEIPGVRSVRGRIVQDVNVDIADVPQPRTGRIVSMPEPWGPVLNDVVVRSGRYFERGAQDETIVSEKFALANGIEIGDTVKVTLDGRKHPLRVVGLGLSPEYVYVIRNVAEMIPAPERFGILWVPQDFAESALNMKAACNNIVGSVDDVEAIDGILEQAGDILDIYGVFSKVHRDNQLSNNFVTNEIIGLSVNSKITPGIFLGIASLVILILLNRMVRNERTQIGLLKSYGYSNFVIGFHYLQYAIILSLAGCLGAVVVGNVLADQMIRMYVQFYQYPVLKSHVYPEVMAQAAGIALGFSILGAQLGARRAARIHPAESMRPESPPRGYRTRIERIAWLWSRLSFTWKMIVRNVSRSKFRAGMNCVGVMISSGLLIVGFFAQDGIEYVLKFQYELSQKEDMKLNFMLERDKSALYEAARFEHVRRAEPLLQYPFELRNGWKKKDVVVTGLARDASLQLLLDDHLARVDVGDHGLVLADNIAEDLNVRAGDFVHMKPLMGRITDEVDVPVSKVVKQYLGGQGYMNIEALSRVLEEPYAMNAVLLRTDPGMAHTVNESLKDLPALASVEIREDSYRNLRNILAKNMMIMSFMLIFFAGVISFSIIYNVTTVSLAERQRELASLRVLGFTIQEVGAILYKENIVASIIGLILGIPFGLSICRFLVKAFDTDLYRFPFRVEPRTLVIATVLTIGFVAIANLAVRRKIHHLNMVEVLKERE